MRSAHLLRAMAGLATLACVGAAAADITSSAPAAVSVTVYRSPRSNGRFELNELGGFALITETRRVTLPAGESTLRFEGVAGGIEAESALVTGLPEGVVEKNRDARLLSPSTLLAAALYRGVELERTNPKSGVTEHIRGTLESDAQGVVFRTAAGVEALRCSGLPETFSFEAFSGGHATPTLSVRVRSETPVTRNVTLSYLASGFDWSATYTATLAPDGKSMTLGAWVTLANGNGETFPEADTAVVAGRLNRETADAAPDAAAGPIIAQCWPRGSTSDVIAAPPPPIPLEAPADALLMRSLAAPSAALAQITVTRAKKVEQEPLGDLKLYRVPDRTTVAARQMKQVRLMDQFAVPVRELYGAQFDDSFQSPEAEAGPRPAMRKLRTRNTAANHLGLPLPSGGVAVFAAAHGTTLLIGETALRDHALDEEVEIDLGLSADVQVAELSAARRLGPGEVQPLPLFPELALRSVGQRRERQLEFTNARNHDVDVELTLRLDGDARVIGADHPVVKKDGRMVFAVRVPAQGRSVLRYAIAKTSDRVIRAR